MTLTVTKIRRIILEKPVPVYDLTSSETHNFALANGAIVHNSIKMAKMPWQECLPLRGKMANVINKKGSVENSEAVGNILSVIGYDPRKPEQKPRVGKVIILTDADDDGDHISVLLLTIFQQVMPTLLERGMVYIVDLPLFEAKTTKGKSVAGDNLAQMERKHGKLKDVNRMKGLASCKVSLLRDIATDPATRRLTQIAAPNKGEAAGLVELMGADSSARKKLLTEKGPDHERRIDGGRRGTARAADERRVDDNDGRSPDRRDAVGATAVPRNYRSARG